MEWLYIAVGIVCLVAFFILYIWLQKAEIEQIDIDVKKGLMSPEEGEREKQRVKNRLDDGGA